MGQRRYGAAACVRSLRPGAAGRVQPATQRYVDLSSWSLVIEEPTVSAVGDGLLVGSYENGIAFASVADEQWLSARARCAMPGLCSAANRWMEAGPLSGQAARWRTNTQLRSKTTSA